MELTEFKQPMSLSLWAKNWAKKSRALSALPSFWPRVSAPVALRSTKPNTLSKRDSHTTVQITHPAHSLQRQILAIKPMVGGKLDSTQILVALPNGEQQLIPTEWTDLVDHPRSLPGALFFFEHLLILRQRVDCLLEKAVKQAILTGNEPALDRSGGS
jgi:hypothetical protein